jgi:hypothetical protein
VTGSMFTLFENPDAPPGMRWYPLPPPWAVPCACATSTTVWQCAESDQRCAMPPKSWMKPPGPMGIPCIISAALMIALTHRLDSSLCAASTSDGGPFSFCPDVGLLCLALALRHVEIPRSTDRSSPPPMGAASGCFCAAGLERCNSIALTCWINLSKWSGFRISSASRGSWGTVKMLLLLPTILLCQGPAKGTGAWSLSSVGACGRPSIPYTTSGGQASGVHTDSVDTGSAHNRASRAQKCPLVTLRGCLLLPRCLHHSQL